MNSHQSPFKKMIRVVARLDVKGEKLIKGVHLEGLRVIGDPHEYARRYYQEGADELIYMDIVASLYGRSNLVEIVRRTAHDVFVPMTVGGGIRTLEDVNNLMKAGADKVAINTAAVHRPSLISEIAHRFGSQCMVLSIEAKFQSPGHWEVYTDCGREKTGLDVVEWAKQAVLLGAGEVLVTSIDNEGTRKGFDDDLLQAISGVIDVPIIASGGFGNQSHLNSAVKSGADAVAIASALHYNTFSIPEIRKMMIDFKIPTRAFP